MKAAIGNMWRALSVDVRYAKVCFIDCVVSVKKARDG